jgi:hypothetical protein
MRQQPVSAVGSLIRPDLLPANVGKGVVRQRLLDRLLDNVGRLAHLTGPQVGDDSVSLPLGSVLAFLRMDGPFRKTSMALTCRTVDRPQRPHTIQDNGRAR